LERELCSLEKNRLGFRFPLHLRAWLSLRNGQSDTIFASGTRLLRASEIIDEREERIRFGVDFPENKNILPISTKSGIKQWFIRNDGSIELQSGWNHFSFGNITDWIRSWSHLL
jgi:hypothetical protein